LVVGAADEEAGWGDDEGIADDDGMNVVGTVEGTADVAEDDSGELDDLEEEGAADEGRWEEGWAEVGTADDSTAELDGATDELDGATGDCETAELAVIGLDDGTTDADEDSNVRLAGAEELSGVDVAVSEGTTEDGDEITEEAINDDDGVEASREEAISEDNDSASDDGAADLGLAIWLCTASSHRPTQLTEWSTRTKLRMR
jgi:hypothetical protein